MMTSFFVVEVVDLDAVGVDGDLHGRAETILGQLIDLQKVKRHL